MIHKQPLRKFTVLNQVKRISVICFSFFIASTGCRSKARDVGSKPSLRKAEKRSQSVDESAIIQKIVDAPELQQFFHQDKDPSRKPLVIAKNEILNREPGVSKFGVPIVFRALNADEMQNAAAIVFEELTIQSGGQSAQARLRYPKEGVVAEAKLKKEDEHWNIKNFSVGEQ